jgi:hypothetical protein
VALPNCEVFKTTQLILVIARFVNPCAAFL